jgi:alkylation response protein AidB-like acyl-CoA dehydrogenase
MTGLSSSDRGILRRCAPEAEKAGRLHPEVLTLIYERQWFRMMVPRRYGGLALSLPEVVRLEEAISREDGSAGWTVTLCSGAGWFAGFFGDGAPAALFSDVELCIAGSGMAAGRADMVPGGYRISGKWGYASGAKHATAFTANCTVWSDGRQLLTEGGGPVMRPFLFLKEEVRVLDDWHAVGLVATGSHGFEVDGLEIPASREFEIAAAAATDDDPLYRYPFLPLAEATLAANCSGMVLHFMECCSDVFSERIGRGQLSDEASGEMLGMLEKARDDMAEKRREFYSALDLSWAAVGRGGLAAMGCGSHATVEPEAFLRVSRASHDLAAGARQWADLLYPYAGLGAARVDSEINRVWRDLHTAGQHPLLVFRRDGR